MEGARKISQMERIDEMGNMGNNENKNILRSQSIGKKKQINVDQVRMLTVSEEYVPVRNLASPPLPSNKSKNLSKSKSNQIPPLVHSKK